MKGKCSSDHVTNRSRSKDDVRKQWISQKDYATSFHAEITMLPNLFTIMTQPFPCILNNDVLTHYPK